MNSPESGPLTSKSSLSARKATCPITGASMDAMSSEAAKKSPYYVDPAIMTPLQKHCAFFDRNGDGLIMPWETYNSMRVLGFGIFLSGLATLLIHLSFSWWTLDTWIPDPFFAIVIRNVHRLKHGSDSGVYNFSGNIEPSVQDAVVNKLVTFDGRKKGGLSLSDLFFMTQRRWMVMDWFGWWASKIEWIFLWILCQHDGVVGWDDVRAQYDGGLFHHIKQQREGMTAFLSRQQKDI